MAKRSKFIVPGAIAAVLAGLGIAAAVVLTGPLNTVMDMYFGRGDLIVNETEGASQNKEYYKSDYESTQKAVEAGKELAATVEKEGIVLLKNKNNALPLKSSETKVSLFGRTTVDPIYTGAGSAASQASPVSYKDAYAQAGLSINQPLYDFYANHDLTTVEHTVDFMTGMGPQKVTYRGRGFISAMGSAQFYDDIIAEVPGEELAAEASLDSTYEQFGDAAIVTIGRVGGEGCDLPVSMQEHAPRDEDKDKHYLELDSRETGMLAHVKSLKDAGKIKKIIVVLNTANALELGWLDDEAYGIDAAIWAGCIGDRGSIGVASVLTGKTNPSGALVDTYVADLSHDPSFANFANTMYSNVTPVQGDYESGCFNQYEEGIYVGYRYYETAAAEAKKGNYSSFDYDNEVIFPFGYGLSYTTFETKLVSSDYADGVFTFRVNVKNTGDVAGKKVVQMYAETPYVSGGIEKAKVVLSAFGKTSLLDPGKDDTLTLTVKSEDLASYDYKQEKAYVLDEGTYKFYLSENAHSWADITDSDTAHFYQHNLSKVVFKGNQKRQSDLTETQNRFDDVSAMFKDVATDGFATNMSRKDFALTYPTEPTDKDKTANETIKYALEHSFDFATDPELGNVEGSRVYAKDAPKSKQNNGLKLIDLRCASYDDPLWEQLLDELDYEKVIDMLGNAGFNTKLLESIGKPATLDYDGPMGWTNWVSASAGDAECIGFPAEEILAATWNTELAEEVGKSVGELGLAYGYNGWYAPAMNTHRSAFAGRNYEYFSEDPLLSGKMAAKETEGAMSKGTYVYLKHFALNDKENGRNGIATWCNEQAIREIYLRPFEIAVKEAEVEIRYNDHHGVDSRKTIKATTGIMSAYNRIGTRWAGGRIGLMTDILRGEWGFHGAVISDYFGGSPYMSPDSAVRAGNDIMLNTFAKGTVNDTSSATGLMAMRKAAKNVLYMVVNSNAMQGITTGATISYSLSPWQKLLIVGEAVDGAIVVGLVVLATLMFVRYRKEKNA